MHLTIINFGGIDISAPSTPNFGDLFPRPPRSF